MCGHVHLVDDGRIAVFGQIAVGQGNFIADILRRVSMSRSRVKLHLYLREPLHIGRADMLDAFHRADGIFNGIGQLRLGDFGTCALQCGGNADVGKSTSG